MSQVDELNYVVIENALYPALYHVDLLGTFAQGTLYVRSKDCCFAYCYVISSLWYRTTLRTISGHMTR
jgi:hypothetical protein